MKRILPLHHKFPFLPPAVIGIFFVAVMFVLCAPLAGCPSQNQYAALVGIAGTAIASLETIEGHTAAAAKVQKDFGAAQTAVLNWKAGTPTQDVAQALQIVIGDLDLLPVSVQDQEYIVLAIGTVQSVLDLFPAANPTPGTVLSPATLTHAQALSISAPKTADEFKSRWNGIGGIAPPLK